MHDEVMNEVVDRLLDDRRFQRRFRRNPAHAVKGYGLTPRQVEALKRGNTTELLELGVRPSTVWPELKPEPSAFAGWLLQGRRTLVPAAMLIALAAAAPAAAQPDRGRFVPGRYVRRRVARVVGRRIGRSRGRAISRFARHIGKRTGRIEARARLARVRARATDAR